MLLREKEGYEEGEGGRIEFSYLSGVGRMKLQCRYWGGIRMLTSSIMDLGI